MVVTSCPHALRRSTARANVTSTVPFCSMWLVQVPPPEEVIQIDLMWTSVMLLTEYLVEIEVPGVKSTSEVTVKWTSTSSLARYRDC